MTPVQRLELVEKDPRTIGKHGLTTEQINRMRLDVLGSPLIEAQKIFAVSRVNRAEAIRALQQNNLTTFEQILREERAKIRGVLPPKPHLEKSVRGVGGELQTLAYVRKVVNAIPDNTREPIAFKPDGAEMRALRDFFYAHQVTPPTLTRLHDDARRLKKAYLQLLDARAQQLERRTNRRKSFPSGAYRRISAGVKGNLRLWSVARARKKNHAKKKSAQ